MIYSRASKETAKLLANFSKFGLFCSDLELHLSFVAIAEVNPGFISAKFLHLIEDMDPAAVDLITFLIADSPGQLHGSDASEDLSAGPGLGTNGASWGENRPCSAFQNVIAAGAGN